MRIVLPILALMCAASVGAAQENYELANALAERGWYDLSTDLFDEIKKDSRLSAQQRAEGDYGLARINIMRAEKAPSAAEKSALFDKAIKSIEGFRKKYPKHPRIGEALSDIGYLYQSKGKALVLESKSKPELMDKAEEAFGKAESLFDNLIKELKKKPVAFPENPKDEKAHALHAAYEEKMMFAKYNYAISLFAHAETFKNNASKQADMKRLLDKMNNFLNNDFMWQYEQYLLAYDSFIYMGRAYQILAESSEREKAEEYWNRCFTYINKARGLLSDRKLRKNPSVREVCMKALMFEMKALMAHGDTKRGMAATKIYKGAIKKADEFFKLLPNARLENMGKVIRLEKARAMCKSNDLRNGITLLKDLARQGKDTWLENLAIDILGEYGGEQDVSLAIDSGDNLYERGPAFFYRAMQKYRNALNAIKKRPQDRKYAPYCYHQLGKCYYLLNRYYEAIAVLSILEKPPYNKSTDAPLAALRKLSALQRLAKITGDPKDQRAFTSYRSWVNDNYPSAASAQLRRAEAIEKEDDGDFKGAADAWRRLSKRGTDTYEESLFSIGYNLYRHGRSVFGKAAQRGTTASQKSSLEKEGLATWRDALKSLKDHLAEVNRMKGKDPRVSKRAVGSIMFSCRMLTSPRINKPKDALAISEDLDKRFPRAEPRLIIGIMSLRIDAKVGAGQVSEAESDLQDLKARYDRDGQGFDHYTRALVVMANAFEETANKEAAKGDEKDLKKLDLFALKAANYYYRYYTLKPDAVRDKPEQAEAMASKLYMAAEQRMKQGAEALGKEGLAEVKEIYTQCLDLYKGYLTDQESRLPDDQKAAINRRITRCYLMTGQHEEAIRSYQDITSKDTGMRNGSAWESLADCFIEEASSLPRGTKRNERLKRADKIYAELAARLMQSQTLNEHTWRLLYKHAETLFKLDLDRCRTFYDSMDLRGYGKVGDAEKWDTDKNGKSEYGFAPRFAELRKKLDAKVPPSSSKGR